ncbi:MAG: hypothetical protein ACK5M3_00505 [Dysgonomonas sp.]
MIKSQFVLDILDLLLDGENGKFLVPQLDYMFDSDYNYTRSGCFVTFTHSEDIVKYRSKEDFLFDGVKIESSELDGRADAILFMKDGIIDYLEIWSFDANYNYPSIELMTYTLIQEWNGSPQRVIKR